MTTKILIVDDEQSILDIVKAYLEKEGYEVTTAMDGPSGLKAAKVQKPDLLILDVMLPGMDGVEVLTQLRRESNIYVIMLTAKSEETDKIVGLSVGADDYLTKPFSPRELVARVKAALRRLRDGSGLPDEKILAFKHLRIDTGSRLVRAASDCWRWSGVMTTTAKPEWSTSMWVISGKNSVTKRSSLQYVGSAIALRIEETDDVGSIARTTGLETLHILSDRRYCWGSCSYHGG
jgi:DNA-binding response OmpR family regulator